MSKLYKIENIVKQLIWCLILPVAFNAFALIGNVAIKPSGIKSWVLPIGIFSIFFFLIIIYISLKVRMRKNEMSYSRDRFFDKKDLVFILLLLVISLCLRLPMYGTFQRWDSGEYFYRIGEACYNYDFTFDKFLNGFNICSHINYGFSGLVGTFMFIAPYSYRVINVVQIICGILAVICLYTILKKKWLLSGRRAFAGALMISMIPIYLGLSTYLTPDFFIFIFFVYALFFQTLGYHIAEGFMMILMVFCKENCALIVLGYYGMSILYTFFKGKAGIKDRFIRVIRSSSFWVAAATACMFLGAFLMVNDKWVADSGNAEKAFVYSRVFIIIRIKQMFFTHFSVIMTMLSLVAMFVIVFKIRKKLSERKLFSDDYMKSLFGLMAAMAFVFLMGVIFHTAITARYDIYFVGCLGIFMLILLNILCLYYENKKISVLYYVITGILSVLFMIESFISIDPLARHWFKQLDLGKGYTISYESEYQDYMGDSLVYNYQYSWMDKAFDALLKDMDYTADKGVYFPFSQYDSGSGIHFAGNGRFYRVAWDSDRKERCYYLKDDDSYTPINTYYLDDYDTYFPYKDLFYDEYIDNSFVPDKGVYTSVNYYCDGDSYLDRLDCYFYRGNKKHIDKGTGRLEYYDIYKKDSFDGGVSVDEIIRSETDPTGSPPESALKTARELLDENYESFFSQVEELYNYKYGMSSEIIQIGVHDRVDVQPMDGVEAGFTVKDKSGRVILSKERISVTVGGVGLIDEIDAALMDMNIDEDRTIEYTVPEHVLGLEDYAGQTVDIDIHVYNIMCLYENKLNEAQLVKLYNDSFDYIWNYYKKILISDIIKSHKEKYDSGDTSAPDQNLSEVRAYMDSYIASLGITEDEFVNDYAHISKEEYEEALVILADSADEMDALYDKLEASYDKAAEY